VVDLLPECRGIEVCLMYLVLLIWPAVWRIKSIRSGVVDLLPECRGIFPLGVGRGLQRVQPAQEQVVLQPTRLPLLLEAGALRQHRLAPGAIMSF
jgi:hypothetical protein